MTVTEDIKARLARIAREDPVLRSFIRVDAEEALAAAAASDVRREEGRPHGPLDGLAVAVKDNLAIRGKAWTAGMAGRRDLIAAEDADAVARLRAAGAVILGGTNLEEAALGTLTDNPTFGRCLNPLGEGLTPGGSSGGSGAAVAAGFVDLALGTDTMGSVRLPAAYCGVAGLKPTFGAVARDGLALLCPSLDTIGPLARDVGLLWPALQALATDNAVLHWDEKPKHPNLEGVRFGVPSQLDTVDLQSEVRAGLQHTIEVIGAVGGIVNEIDLADWSPHTARRAGLLIIEAEGAEEMKGLLEVPHAMSEHLKSLLAYGQRASPEKLAGARADISRIGRAVEAALVNVDVILLPTAPQRAFAQGTPAPVNQADLMPLANFSGCPAVALPVALRDQALPASIQMVANRWADPKLCAWAEVLAPLLRKPV